MKRNAILFSFPIAIESKIVYFRYFKTLTFIKPMLLKELLKAKGIKQVWIANRLGVSEVTVSNWCAGKSVPKKSHVEKLSKLLDVPANAIVNR